MDLKAKKMIAREGLILIAFVLLGGFFSLDEGFGAFIVRFIFLYSIYLIIRFIVWAIPVLRAGRKSGLSETEKIEPSKKIAKLIKSYLWFKGRVSRWGFIRYYLVVFLILALFDIPATSFNFQENTFYKTILITLCLFIFIFSSFNIIKRLHDLNMSGFLWLCSLIPFVNLYFDFLWCFKKGTDGPNKYGDDPLEKKG